MTKSPFVVLDGIAKRWNGQLGVEGISLDIPEGSFTALLGPSGCGKSTTLRLLAGLELPDEGQIFIDGKDVTTSAASDRNLSMVFQSYALFPHLSVAENVVFGLKVRRVPKKERQEKLHRALEITGLLGYENRKPGELSGGQRQRVALARAIVAGQRLCLMDEPLSNLDAKLRNSVRKDIKKLQRDLGITVVYVTHDQTEAMSMADTVVLMKDGHIQQVGTPENLYNSPNNTFVAEFVGAPPMALIGTDALSGFEQGKTIGVRAENIQIVPKGEGRMSCTVNESEFLGSETLIGLDHANAAGLCVLKPGLSMMPEGDQIDITFNDEHLHVFDAAGQRLAG
ncbi:MAG: ABC transporter ATP-binding protein [Planktotalea sp.]|jgi:sn-glycerol 3-phosphate transport system ATP-binding protein|uniref:ABC transporter ATP-binding protein n=1 Tax=Planktotalea sp. TaxID=2029877 RepID=UPI000183B140|nr:ABC transporter ATP-binding protein [Planktotalea sp.]EDZ43287.1 ferric cations import ATP-binding protein FbpC [Rhodobacteraceae bacterium HTCC2083]MDG1076172.1 ABC transporter ATP-binding protein [Planktotalea sp.]MDG1084212.1 ABC transporter ATP-binding protein [Planktotalea sp.]HCW83496.1 ABC transporter ATP-binding protein [Paracoccaceae bacterium]